LAFQRFDVLLLYQINLSFQVEGINFLEILLYFLGFLEFVDVGIYCYVESSKGKVLHLIWNQRAVNTMLLSSYALLLLLLAKEANMISGILMGSLGDVHVYENHVE